MTSLIERNTWLQEKLEHEQECQNRAEWVSNRSRTGLALRGHSIEAPGAGLYPDHPDQGHHHRRSDHLDQLAWDAERDDQHDRDQCRQCGDVENESRPLPGARQLGRLFGSAEQMTRQPQSRRRDEGEGHERRCGPGRRTEPQVVHCHRDVAVRADGSDDDLRKSLEEPVVGHPDEEQSNRGRAG
jgi:hypothetical protein